MLFASAEEEEDRDQKECRPGFHEGREAIGPRRDCNL
jgi:hypothetical protein